MKRIDYIIEKFTIGEVNEIEAFQKIKYEWEQKEGCFRYEFYLPFFQGKMNITKEEKEILEQYKKELERKVRKIIEPVVYSLAEEFQKVPCMNKEYFEKKVREYIEKKIRSIVFDLIVHPEQRKVVYFCPDHLREFVFQDVRRCKFFREIEKLISEFEKEVQERENPICYVKVTLKFIREMYISESKRKGIFFFVPPSKKEDYEVEYSGREAQEVYSFYGPMKLEDLILILREGLKKIEQIEGKMDIWERKLGSDFTKEFYEILNDEEKKVKKCLYFWDGEEQRYSCRYLQFYAKKKRIRISFFYEESGLKPVIEEIEIYYYPPINLKSFKEFADKIKRLFSKFSKTMKTIKPDVIFRLRIK